MWIFIRGSRVKQVQIGYICGDGEETATEFDAKDTYMYGNIEE